MGNYLEALLKRTNARQRAIRVVRRIGRIGHCDVRQAEPVGNRCQNFLCGSKEAKVFKNQKRKTIRETYRDIARWDNDSERTRAHLHLCNRMRNKLAHPHHQCIDCDSAVVDAESTLQQARKLFGVRQRG